MIEEKENLKKNIHNCYTLNKKTDNCMFCHECGILLSKKKNPKKKFFRSKKIHNKNNLLKADGNVITSNLLKKQYKNRYYNNNPPHINFRSEIISWFKNLKKLFEFSEATYYLSISYFDSVFSMCEVRKEEIKLVGFVCFFMAGKMNEKIEKTPSIDKIVKFFKTEYSKDQFLNCENTIFKLLDFSLNIKTPYVFLSYFLYRGILSNYDIFYKQTTDSLIQEQLVFFEDLAFKILDFSLSMYDFYQYISVAVAAACIASARKIFGFKEIWTNELCLLTNLTWENIQNCTKILLDNFFKMNSELIEIIYIRKKDLDNRIEKSFGNFINTPVKNNNKFCNLSTTVTKKNNVNENYSFSEEEFSFDNDNKKNLFKNYNINRLSNKRKNENSQILENDEIYEENNEEKIILENENKKKLFKNYKKKKICKKNNEKIILDKENEFDCEEKENISKNINNEKSKKIYFTPNSNLKQKTEQEFFL